VPTLVNFKGMLTDIDGYKRQAFDRTVGVTFYLYTSSGAYGAESLKAATQHGDGESSGCNPVAGRGWAASLEETIVDEVAVR
jgi:hypothetical protein